MWEYHRSKKLMLPLIIHRSNPLQIYIVALSIVSSWQGVTSALSHDVNWNGRWAPSSLPPCPSFLKQRAQACIALSIIFPIHIFPPQMQHQSTLRSNATTSCAPGTLSQQSLCSLPVFLQAPRPLYVTSQRHTEQSPSGLNNGLGSSSGCRPMTSLRSMFATISASRQPEEYMGIWQMLELTFSEGKEWGCWQSGWTIIFSSKSYEHIYLATMHSAQYGVRRSKQTGGVGRKEVAYGMEERPSPAAWQKNLMRTVTQASVTSLTSPRDPELMMILPMQTWTLTDSRPCWASNGRAPRRFPLVKRCPTWASAGICAHRWCTYQMKRRPSIWQQSRSGRQNAHITSSKHKNSMESYRTLLWLSQRDALISQTWRPCSPPSTVVLSFHTRPLKVTRMTLPGGNPDSGTQASPSLSLAPAPSSNTEHSQTQALVSAWQSQWACDGKHGGGPQAGNPREGTSNGPRPSASSSSQSAFSHYRTRATMLLFMGTTGESLRGGGKGAVPTGPPTMFSNASSSFRRIVAEWYIQGTYQARRTQQTPHLEASTLPVPSYSAQSPSLAKHGPSSSMSDPGELAKSTTVKCLVRA